MHTSGLRKTLLRTSARSAAVAVARGEDVVVAALDVSVGQSLPATVGLAVRWMGRQGRKVSEAIAVRRDTDLVAAAAAAVVAGDFADPPEAARGPCAERTVAGQAHSGDRRQPSGPLLVARRTQIEVGDATDHAGCQVAAELVLRATDWSAVSLAAADPLLLEEAEAWMRQVEMDLRRTRTAADWTPDRERVVGRWMRRRVQVRRQQVRKKMMRHRHRC